MNNIEVKEMGARAGLRTRYSFLERNRKGEHIIVELCHCSNPGGSNSLPALWEKNGFIDRILETHICVSVNAIDEKGDCFRKYNPTETEKHKINFAWMLEDTEENRARLMEEIERRAFA